MFPRAARDECRDGENADVCVPLSPAAAPAADKLRRTVIGVRSVPTRPAQRRVAERENSLRPSTRRRGKRPIAMAAPNGREPVDPALRRRGAVPMSGDVIGISNDAFSMAPRQASDQNWDLSWRVVAVLVEVGVRTDIVALVTATLSCSGSCREDDVQDPSRSVHLRGGGCQL